MSYVITANGKTLIWGENDPGKGGYSYNPQEFVTLQAATAYAEKMNSGEVEEGQFKGMECLVCSTDDHEGEHS